MSRTPHAWPLLLLAALVAAGPARAATPEERHSDLWMEAQIVTSYTLNEHLNPFSLTVDVEDGVARLGGTVESGVERQLAGAIAEGVEGVREVRNEIRVAPGAGRGGGEAPPGGFARTVRDATITAKVKSRLLWNREASGLDVSVDTRDGVVTLRGTVGSGAERDLVVQLARNTSGVRRVVDELRVAPGEEGGEDDLSRVRRSVNDGWITAKVKSTLLYTRGLEGLDIGVDTRDGVVTLEGDVESQAQKSEILDAVRGVVGVVDVVDHLTVGGRMKT